MNSSQLTKFDFQITEDQSQEYQKKRSREAREHYTQNPRFCPQCNDQLPYEKRYNKFCDSSCSAAYTNVRRTRQTKPKGTCVYCGQPKEKRQNKYCDGCIEAGVYNKSQTLGEIKTDRTRRFFLLRTRGHFCEECGLSEWRNQPIPLELDHIDGNPDNNIDENLRLICPNCHALTPTYKGKGIIAGRHSRRKKMRRDRYAQGKSY